MKINSINLISLSFLLSLGSFAHGEAVSGGPSEESPKTRVNYCSGATPTSACKSDRTVDFNQAGKFILDCKQKCSDLNLIDRSEWGATASPPICSKADRKKDATIERLRLEREQAKCNKNTELYKQKNEAIESIITASGDLTCVSPLKNPKAIVIHHTTGRAIDIKPQAIQAGHKKKWLDIGYHFIIAMDENGKWQMAGL